MRQNNENLLCDIVDDIANITLKYSNTGEKIDKPMTWDKEIRRDIHPRINELIKQNNSGVDIDIPTKSSCSEKQDNSKQTQETSYTMTLKPDWSSIYMKNDMVEFISDKTLYRGRILKELPRKKYLIAYPWGDIEKVKHKNIIGKMEKK